MMPSHSIPLFRMLISFATATAAFGIHAARAEQLMAGAAKVDITHRDAGPVNDPLFVKALVVKDQKQTVVLVTLDAVAVGGIGYVKDDYLPKVRARLEQEFGIQPRNVLVNASHCHGIVSPDVDRRTIQAVQAALANLVPVRVAAGTGQEDRIQENRRIKLKDGRTIDVRHAYSLPPDAEMAEVGPIDPEIGILRLDRLDGRSLAVVYNFACHPIQGVASGGNTADLSGFASQALEDSLDEGTIALFVQGCGGDINPIGYKDVDYPRHAEPLGNRLALSTLRALRQMRSRDDARLRVINETLALPRANTADRIVALEAEQTRLLQTLHGTSLNLKTFLPLVVKYSLAEDSPSAYAYRYLHEKQMGRQELQAADELNRRNLQQYIANIYTMEELTRLQTNLALLKKHQATNIAAGDATIDVELTGLRIGDFVLVSFPGELTVEIGLNIKRASPHEHTFVAGYTNGYIYYCPTADQLSNAGGAQEDSDCLLAPAWQKNFEARAAQILNRL